MNESADRVEGTRIERNARLGIAALYAFGMAVAMGVSPLFKVCESVAGSYWPRLLIQVAVAIPFLVFVGYAFAIPLLWFRSVFARYGLGVLAALPPWIIFLIGVSVAYGGPSGEDLSQITGCLMMGLMGGAIPISVVVYACRWRIGMGAAKSIPVGISDFLALITFGAVVIAYLTQSSMFDEENIPIGFLAIIISFYALGGMAVFMSLLLAMRITLGFDDRPFHPLNIVGILLTMLVTSSVWMVLLVAGAGTTNNGPVPVVAALVNGAVTWMVAAGAAVTIGWWLRRCGLRLTTR